MRRSSWAGAQATNLVARCRRFGLALALLLAGVQAAAQVPARWDTIGPAGGTISALFVSPSVPGTVYAATPENGVFVSADAGLTWQTANSGLSASSDVGRQTLLSVSALVSDGRYLYAATGSGLFYADAALSAAITWSPMSAPASGVWPTMLAFDDSTQRLFAASRDVDTSAPPRVYVAPVGPAAAPTAAVWTAASLPDTTIGSAVAGLAIVPTGATTVTGALLVAVGNGVQAASILPGALDLAWNNADPGAVLAAGMVEAIGYSPDFSQAYACSGSIPYYSGNPLDLQPVWLPASLPAGAMMPPSCTGFGSISIAAGGAPNLLLGTDQGLLTSADGTRFDATGSLAIGPAANAFAVTVPGGSGPQLLVGGGFGVAMTPLATLGAGVAWTARNGPASVGAGGGNLRLNNVSVSDTAVMGGVLYAAASSSAYGEVLASRDGGANWSGTGIGAVLNPGETPTRLVADVAHGLLYVATTQGLLAYQPSGARWAVVAAASIGPVSAMALGSTHLLVGTDTGLFAVALGTAPGAATAVGLATLAVKALLVAGGSVYVGTRDANDDSAVFYAGESAVAAGSATWSSFGAGTVGRNSITSLLLIGDTLLAGTAGGLVRYATVAAPWAPANASALPEQQIADTFGIVSALYSDGVTVFAATRGNGVFVMPQGTSFIWTPFNGTGANALPSLELRSLRADGTTLYASTRAGVAAFSGVTAAPTPPPPPSGGGSSGGGGAIDERWALLLLTAVAALGFVRTRSRARSAKGPGPRSR